MFHNKTLLIRFLVFCFSLLLLPVSYLFLLSPSRNKPNILESEKWSLYIVTVKNFLLKDHELVDIKPLNVSPSDMHAGSELRSYDPFVLSFLSIDGEKETYLIYEPCYFKKGQLTSSGKPSYDCNIQYSSVNLYGDFGKSYESRILYDPRFKVSYPFPTRIQNKLGIIVESSTEMDLYFLSIIHDAASKSLKVDDAYKILSNSKGYYDPNLFEDLNGNFHLILSSSENMKVCTRLASNVTQLSPVSSFFSTTDCVDYELGAQEGERNAGSFFVDDSSGSLFRFAMNNKIQYGHSVDLYRVHSMSSDSYSQELVRKNILNYPGLGFKLYHHVHSLDIDSSENVHTFLIDAAVNTYTYLHGKKYIKQSPWH